LERLQIRRYSREYLSMMTHLERRRNEFAWVIGDNLLWGWCCVVFRIRNVSQSLPHGVHISWLRSWQILTRRSSVGNVPRRARTRPPDAKTRDIAMSCAPNVIPVEVEFGKPDAV
jgi:hypothetical protein